eukprot:4872497-Amphidinium_carterae.1
MWSTPAASGIPLRFPAPDVLEDVLNTFTQIVRGRYIATDDPGQRSMGWSILLTRALAHMAIKAIQDRVSTAVPYRVSQGLPEGAIKQAPRD